MNASKSSKQSPSFEDAIERLEAIVEGLETGDLSLEDSLARFEEGVGLARRCQELLKAAEHRITQLLGEGEGEDAVEVDMVTGEVLEEEGD